MERKKKLEEEKTQQQAQVDQIKGDPNFAVFRKRHEEQFRALFDFYYNYLFLEEKKRQTEPMVPKNLFNKFCSDFLLVPLLLKPRD